MSGFYLTNEVNAPTTFWKPASVSLRHQEKHIEGWTLSSDVTLRFAEHKVFFEDASVFVMTDGIITNAHHLGIPEHPQGLGGWIRDAYAQDPLFFKRFRGSFSGAVLDRKMGEWTIYTCPTGERGIFYWTDPESRRVIVGSRLHFVTETMRKAGIPRRPDKTGFRQFMNFGSFTDTHTGVEGIRRLYPGDYLRITPEGVTTKPYHVLPAPSFERRDRAKSIDKLQKALATALEDGVYWNEKYEYQTLVDLSGGADTRILFYALQGLAPDNLEALTYAQSGSRDARIARDIAADAGVPWHFMPMDTPSFLTEVDTLMRMNNGACYYFGITGGKQMLERLASPTWGIEWTGIAGDIHEGAMLTENGEDTPDETMDRYRLSRHLPMFAMEKNEEAHRYQNNDTYWLVTRGFLAAASTNFIRQYYTEPLMPLADADVLDALLEIPWEQRVCDKIQMRWLKRYYPQSLRYAHSGTGIPLSHEFFPWHVLERKIHTGLIMLKAKKNGKPSAGEMNPLDYWWKTASDVRQKLTDYYKNYVSAITEAKLQSAVRELFECGEHFVDRGLALSVISYFRNYLD